MCLFEKRKHETCINFYTHLKVCIYISRKITAAKYTTFPLLQRNVINMISSISSSCDKSCLRRTHHHHQHQHLCKTIHQIQTLDKIYVKRMFRSSLNKGIYLILYLTLLITISQEGVQGKCKKDFYFLLSVERF